MPTALPFINTASDLLSVSGTDTGDTVATLGYYAINDGGHLMYVWDDTSTATPDGYDSSHPGLIVRPTAISSGDPGRWIAQVDRSEINAKWFGVRADGIQDDTPYIQSAINRAINKDSTWPWGCSVVRLPGGSIKTTDTIHLGYGSAAYSMVSLVGTGKRGAYFVFSGTQIKPNFTDSPVINIQGGRHVSIESIGIIGTLATTSINSGLPANESAWDAIVSTDAKKQFAGISIDAYSGTESSGGYDNAPAGWSKYHTSDVKIRECYIANVGCGVIIKPSGGDNNGDYVEIHDTHISACKYGFSVNGSQARGNRLVNCKVIDCFAAVGVGYFGPNMGRDVFIEGCALEGNTWCIRGQNTDWIGKYVINNSFGERCSGIVDLANGGGNCSVTISNNSFVAFNGDDSTSEVRQHISTPACNLSVLNNRFIMEGTTRPTLIIRPGSACNVDGNIFVRTASRYGGAPNYAIISATGAAIKPSGRNAGGDYIPAPLSAPYGSATMTSASYDGSRRFSCAANGQGTVLQNANVDDVVIVASSSDKLVEIYKVISKTNAFSACVIELVTECDLSDPISPSGCITRLGSARSGAILVQASNMIKADRSVQ
jgi:hypothetical protein